MTVEITNTFAHEVAAHEWSTRTETEWVAETNLVDAWGRPVRGYGETEQEAIEDAKWLAQHCA